MNNTIISPQDELKTSLTTLMQQLEQTQWLSADIIVQQQYQQLVKLVTHAAKHSPYFQARMLAAGISPQEFSSVPDLAALPIISRRDLQSAGESFFCRQLPRDHLPIRETRSSGSSGEPVIVKRTAVNHLFWFAFTMRDHLWQQRDFSGKLAVIRAKIPANGPEDYASWGLPTNLFYKTGTAHAMQITTDVAQQAAWLQNINPDYLLTYPTNLAALLRQFEQHNIKLPKLRQVRSIGETLSAEIRAATRITLGVEISDIYSSQELGVIAIPCPHSGLYHVMSESLIVEILDEQNKACLPGHIGRLVITDMYNFATPLIRYDLGDYAEVAAACPCGRGLPVLKRIAGRERNMLLLPDGRRYWPRLGQHQYREIAPIRQYQLIQRNRELLEVRLVSDSPVTAAQEARLSEIIHQSVGFPFQLQFIYFPEQLPRGRGGKFEEFVCEIAEQS